MSKSVIPLAMATLLLAAAPAFAGDDKPALGLDRLNHIGRQMNSLGKDVVSFFGFGGAQANNPTDPQPVAAPVAEPPRPELTAHEIQPAVAPVAQASLPGLPVAWEPPTPRVETPLHRLFCVEYARIRSGFNIVGDAKQWWAHAASNLYNRMSRPVEEAVMVFSGSRRLRKGHVAVVTSIVGPRQIIVDQANWQNHGEIDHATPVLDVSKNNDWSQVRVWDIPSGTFGARTYAISGFIARQLTRQASAN